MIACSGNHINIKYSGEAILENVTFEVSEKDRIGIVGRNGSGKTTLLNMLSKRESPHSGEIHWKKGLSISYLTQLPNFPAGMKVAEVLKTAFNDLVDLEREMNEIELEISLERNEKKLSKLVERYGNKQEQFTLKNGYEMSANIDRVAHGLNMTNLLEKPFDTLSGGEKTKVSLGILLLQNRNLLLLDEPTNHLDIQAVEWLGRFLNEFHGTVIIISHDRYFLDEVVTKVFDIEGGELNVYHTNFSNYVVEKEKNLLNEFQKYEEQQKKIKKMKEAIKRLREWANQATPPNESLHKRARSMEKALERMEKRPRPILNRKKMNIDLQSSGRSGTDAIVVNDVSKSFREKVLFKNVDMHIRYQDRAVLIGDNGTGKSTFLKILLGEELPDHGLVKLGSQVNVGYLAQHVFSSQDETKTIIEAFREEVDVSEAESRHLLAKFLFYGHAVYKKLRHLSGGERMRLRLAQLMHQEVNLLVIDEPTNHLDIESREVLEDTLKDHEGTILAVSHDRYFINKLFEQVYWISEEQMHFFKGNYDYARQKFIEKKETSQPPADEEKNLKNEQKNKGKRNPKKKQKTIIEVETDLERIETKIEELDRQLMQENDVETLQQWYEEKEALEKEREDLYSNLERLLDCEK
ncbi:ATP-binding cassette domain-containing protein [Bacillus shivajii]|uniref:ribosomal protection-like ABC-F family protein n=1 Tax=Bacillus shivajii TaxID=1983719 RepID=UPI001CF93B09|nr:ABC-F family ATP-binding cassette domain-containing protein [Bacillus shivajii]UCZ53076.1 ATP-binding cassette domain-containing protein [Bacillus shivajii]